MIFNLILPALFALLIGAITAHPALMEVLHKGTQWPIVSAHDESVSLATYGRWWIEQPHRFISDAFSGDLPTFYNYLGDTLLNALSSAIGWPPVVVQVVLWAPLLAIAFFLLNRLCLKVLFRDDKLALWGALLMSLFADSGILGLVPWHVQPNLRMVMHVPYHALPLANAQSLGWVLFLPALTLFHLARERLENGRPRRWAWVIGAGAFFGIVFQAHTLTFINILFVEAVYLAHRRFRRQGASVKLWVAGQLLALTAVAGWLVIRHMMTLPVLALALAFVMVVHLITDRKPGFLVGYYGTFVLVCAPYLSHVLNSKPLLNPGPPNALAVKFGELLLFYLLPFICLGLVVRFRRKIEWPDHSGWFLTALFTGTSVLAFNNYWHWANHPYRFAINLCIPFSIVAALAITRIPFPRRLRHTATVLAVVFAGFVLRNAWAYANVNRLYAKVDVYDAERAALLKQVAAQTHPGARILNPPEFDYAVGTVQSAVLLSYSKSPGYIPDYRYQLQPERYRNRMALFCWLFPDYPHFEIHTTLRACEEKIPSPFKTDRLRPLAIPALGIEWAAAPGEPFASVLKRAAGAYGWKSLYAAGSRTAFYSTHPQQAEPGVLAPSKVSQSGTGYRIEFAPPNPGESRSDGYLLLGIYEASKRKISVRTQGEEIPFENPRVHWLKVATPAARALDFEVTAEAVPGSPDFRDSLFFAGYIENAEVERVIDPTWNFK